MYWVISHADRLMEATAPSHTLSGNISLRVVFLCRTILASHGLVYFSFDGCESALLRWSELARAAVTVILVTAGPIPRWPACGWATTCSSELLSFYVAPLTKEAALGELLRWRPASAGDSVILASVWKAFTGMEMAHVLLP